MIHSVTFEWVAPRVAIVRVHPSPAAVLGDPYVWWTVLKVHHITTVELKGADRPIPPGGARALRDALRAADYQGRIHYRNSGGTVRAVLP